MTKRTFFTVLLAFLLLLAAAGGAYYVFRSTQEPQEFSPEIEQAEPRSQEQQATPAVEAGWNTYHGGSTLMGVAKIPLLEENPVSVPSTAGEDARPPVALLWRFKAGAPVRQTPVVLDRRIFFATARGEVIAVDFAGERLWSRELFTGKEQKGVPERERIDAPVACFDGLVFVGTLRGMLYALDSASGTEKWHTQIDSPIKGTVNYLRSASGGRVYVIGSAEGVLHCLDADSGGVLWKSEAIARCDGSPSVSSEAIVFGSCASALHVFSPDTGKLLRNVEIGEDSQVAGGVALDGDRAVSGCRSGKVIEADCKTGQIVWTNSDSQAETFATPAVTPEWVVESSNDGIVYGLERATGKQRWKFDTKGSPSSPVIAGDKVVVAADGELFLLALADGAKVWSLKISDDITSPAVIQGMILVGSEDGTLAAFGPVKE